MSLTHATTRRLLQAPRLQSALFHVHARNASSSIKPTRKPIVLEKPAKFTPPSHAARLARRAPRGAALPTYERNESEKEKSATKQYPHMMPPEGTFMHWFLTNRMIHVWITMSILTALAFFTFLTNFLTSTPYRDQLPPNNFFFSHPFAFVSQYIQVYHLHTQYVSEKTAEHRRQKVEDVRKRSEYRAAHGLDKGALFGGSGLGGWTVKGDDEVMGPGMKESGLQGGLEEEMRIAAATREGGEGVMAVSREEGADVADGEVKRRPIKKWLGIW